MHTTSIKLNKDILYDSYNTTPTYANHYGIVVQESKTNEGSTTNTSTMPGTKGNIYLISNDRTLSWVDGSAGGSVFK